MIRVLTQYFRVSDANKHWAGCRITECLLETVPRPNSCVMVIMSIFDPGEFSKHMVETLARRIAWMKDADECSVAIRAELKCILDRKEKDMVVPTAGLMLIRMVSLSREGKIV